METLIARQPIFNQHKRIYAYELLYRGAEALSLAQVGGSRATSSLLTSSYLTEGLEKISNNKPCFINFTEELLLKDIAANFPNNKIVVEILEDVPPTPEVVAEINSQEIMIDRVTAIIAGDVALSYKLLRYINSAYFGLANKVESIPRAVTMLGLNEVRRFVTLQIPEAEAFPLYLNSLEYADAFVNL
jgi:c-di-GMP-related signal transduction protein